MSPTLEKILLITDQFCRGRGLPENPAFQAESRISQDALIFGIDVDEYAAALASEFGAVVFEIPWLRFTDQTASFRGWSCLLLPFWLIARVPAWMIGRVKLLPHPDPQSGREQLTLGHVAKVIDAGHWIEP